MVVVAVTAAATLHRKEYRVTHQRAGWSRAQARTFGTEEAARRHVAKLLAAGRPELAPLVHVGIDVRPVGRWERFETVVDFAVPTW